MLLCYLSRACDAWAQKRAPGAFLACLLVSLRTLARLDSSTGSAGCLAHLHTADRESTSHRSIEPPHDARHDARFAGRWCCCAPAHSARARGGAVPYEWMTSAENNQRNRRPHGDMILMLVTLDRDPRAGRRRTQASSPGRSRSERTAWGATSDPNRGSWTATRSSV